MADDIVSESRHDIDSDPRIRQADRTWRIGTLLFLGAVALLTVWKAGSFGAAAGTINVGRTESRLETTAVVGLVTGI
jgi:hypothetical protein